jgi:glucose-1-phosphate thymidylyltransferase
VPKAVILAAGRGTRMRRSDSLSDLDAEQSRLADAGLKAMIPVGRPVLDYTLSALADAGVGDVCIVIGRDHSALRERYTRECRPTRLRVDFAVQREPRGTADALVTAREFAGSDDFLCLNADNYYPAGATAELLRLEGHGLIGFRPDALVRMGNIDAGRIPQYALLQVDRDGYLDDIVEKPDESSLTRLGAGALVSMNLWRFSEAVFEACARVAPSVRGELELPAAVRLGVRELGQRFRVVESSEGVLDLSSRADVTAVAGRLRGMRVRL